jgi:hypothetical protein
MANFAFFDSAWISPSDCIQTIRTAMLLDHGKLDLRFAARTPAFGTDDRIFRNFRFSLNRGMASAI